MFKKLLMVGFLSTVFLSGCMVDTYIGETNEMKSKIHKSDEKNGEINLDMGVGEINLSSGSDEFADLKFLFNDKKLTPELSEKTESDTKILNIKSPSSKDFKNLNFLKDSVYRWDVKINKSFNTNLNISAGVGKANIDLKDCDIEDLNIEMGTGDLTLDISTKYSNDLNVDISSGVGNMTIYLPKDFGVQVNISEGVGTINSGGLISKDGFYQNNKFGETKNSINLNISAGVGNIDLIQK